MQGIVRVRFVLFQIMMYCGWAATALSQTAVNSHLALDRIVEPVQEVEVSADVAIAGPIDEVMAPVQSFPGMGQRQADFANALVVHGSILLRSASQPATLIARAAGGRRPPLEFGLKNSETAFQLPLG